MTIDYQARIKKLLAQVSVELVAFVPGENMRYFTGLEFHLSERPTMAFASPAGLSFLVPKLEMQKLLDRPDLKALAFEWSDADGYSAALQALLQHHGVDKGVSFGVDGMTMRVFEFLALGQAGANLASLHDVGQALLKIRAIKTVDELAAMREAVDISEEALRRTLTWVQVGMTEQTIAQKLNEEMTILGAEGFAFNTTVLVGTNSANPHGSVGNRELGENDVLLIDFGAIKDGYPADITRTFCLGELSAEMQKIHQAVYEANKAAREFAKPGVTCHEVDQAAREVIKAAGYGHLFTHRLGHGLGLAVHELPNMAENNHMVLEVGMVFTIEPGIYDANLGGVRIEDDVVVTENGIESLTTFPREWQIN